MAEITQFERIRIGAPLTSSLVDASLRVARSLQQSIDGPGDLQVQAGASRLALIAAMGTSTALLAFASATCSLGPAPADIGVTVDSVGNLILRCGHSPPHEWDYGSGQQILRGRMGKVFALLPATAGAALGIYMTLFPAEWKPITLGVALIGLLFLLCGADKLFSRGLREWRWLLEA